MTFFKAFRTKVERYLTITGEPASLAVGSALGVFLGIMPVFPFRTLILVALAAIARGNLLAGLIIATIIANPFVVVFWYYLAIVLGNIITPFDINWERIADFLETSSSLGGLSNQVVAVANLGLETLIVLFVGGAAIALPASLITFIVAYRYFNRRSRSG